MSKIFGLNKVSSTKTTKHSASKKGFHHQHNLSVGQRKAYLKNCGELKENQTFKFIPNL